MLQNDSTSTLYNSIGQGYSMRRAEDPFLYQRILDALEDAQIIVNVGAGAGSYEPRERTVLAIEPSETMIRQRPIDSLPSIKATADKLPLHDQSVDAAMTILSLHHWYPNQRNGVLEMLRIARKRVVIVTIDPRVSGQMWLMSDYLREVATLDHQIFPLPEIICEWLGPTAKIETVPIKKNTSDWMLLSFWAHPERVFDPVARAATSGFARQSEEVVNRVISELKRDLEDGSWDKRYGYLRTLSEFDAGLRLITARTK